MSEPLDPITLRRLAYTEAAKHHVRMIDLPAVAQDIRLGTLHMQPRAPVVRRWAAMTPGVSAIITVQLTVADLFGVPAGIMRTDSKARNHVLPRQIAMLLCRRIIEPRPSYEAIGTAFLRRHLEQSSLDSIVKRLRKDEALAERYRQAEAESTAALGRSARANVSHALAMGAKP